MRRQEESDAIKNRQMLERNCQSQIRMNIQG